MAALSLENAVLPPEAQAQPRVLSLEDAVPTKTQDKEDMPSFWEAVHQGFSAALTQAQQSKQALSGEKVQATKETSPAAEGFDWGDVTSPISRGLPKIGYQLAESSPTIAGGILGGVAGSAADPVVGPLGTLGGGVMGAAMGSALQKIGPSFATELEKSPNDPDGAWTRAMEHAAASGVFSGLGWGLFPARMFSGPLKNLAFQALGVQPAVSMGEQATQNIISGQPATQGLGQAYTQGAVGTGVPMLGHAVVGALGRRTAPPQSEPTPTGAGLPPREEAQVNADMVEAHKAIDDQIPPPPSPVLREPSRWDKVPFIGAMRSMADGWKRSFQPELFGDLALQSEGFFREYNAARAQQKDAIVNNMDSMRYVFQRMPETERIDFIKAMGQEEGKQVPPELEPYAATLSHLLNWVHDADKDAGSKLGYVENYFPREFVDPNRAAAFINARVQSLGPRWFQKARTNDLLQEGLDAGLQLRTTNPIDLVTNRLLSSVDMRAKVKLLDQLSDLGVAQKITNPEIASDYSRAGWQLVTDPIKNQYAIHPDVQPLWKNVIDSTGLWNNEGVAGNVFRSWMAFKNAWVPLKLAVSLFHPLHVAHINLVDGMARGWEQLKTSDPVAALNSVAKGIYGQVYFPEAMAAKKAWLTPEWAQESLSPLQQANLKLMTEGGFSPQLSEQLRMKGHVAYQDALAAQNWAKAIPLGFVEKLRQAQGLIFEKWIPNLKTAAYLDEAKTLLDRRPDLIDNEVARRAALGTIAKSVDNRFGEMFYSNLFWNKTLKDTGIGSFLSLGWNLGFIREFGGGLLEPFLRPLVEQTPTRQAVNAAKNKTAFALLYFTNAMILNALMTKGMTGESPEGMDYFLPRMGGNNPDGSPRRLSNMFYTREVPMATKHIEERQSPIAGLGAMLWNKMLFEPFAEMWNNKDYFGYNIMDESSPWYQRYYQLGKYILSDQLNPIAITGAKRALQISGKWNDQDPLYEKAWKIMSEREGQLSLLGFGPAPTYASKSAAQNRLDYLFRQFVAPAERPQTDREVMELRREARNALMMAQQTKDPATIEAASKRLTDLGMTSRQIRSVQPGTADLYEYKRLPQSVQASFLKGLSREDFLRYYPSSAKKTKGDSEVGRLARKYYGWEQ